MTQLECPQCNSEITSCPHCGFPLEETEVQVETEQPKSPLEAPRRSLPLGATLVVAGVLGMVGSLFLIISTVVGLVFFVLSAVVMVLGVSLIIGFIVADCPFCGHKVQMAAYRQSVTCRHCKTVSVCKNNHLELL